MILQKLTKANLNEIYWFIVKEKVYEKKMEKVQFGFCFGVGQLLSVIILDIDIDSNRHLLAQSQQLKYQNNMKSVQS